MEPALIRHSPCARMIHDPVASRHPLAGSHRSIQTFVDILALHVSAYSPVADLKRGLKLYGPDRATMDPRALVANTIAHAAYAGSMRYTTRSHLTQAL